jgi:NAD(P)H-hydrate epimerase
MKLVTVSEMREIEKTAVAAGISNEKMMQRAGEGIAKFIREKFEGTTPTQIIGLIGTGNNGGDALVAMGQLLKIGWQCTAVLISPRPADPLFETFLADGGQAILFADADFEQKLKKLLTPDVTLVDGLLGTGIKLPLRSEWAQLLGIVKKNLDGQKVVAIDCPSGIDCDSGEAAPETMKATFTVCMEAVKIGLVTESAFGYCGQIEVIPLGLPRSVIGKGNGLTLIDQRWAQEKLPARSAFSHKGTFGKVMVVGGSVNYCGAPVLSGLAAYRTGSGLITLAVPQPVALMMAGTVPEITWVILDEVDGVIAETASELLAKKLAGYNCMVLGPGIGREETTQRFLQKLVFPPETKTKRKMGFLEEEPANLKSMQLPSIVIDADALRWLATQENWENMVHARMVLTPHPGEMAALTGLPMEKIQEDRLGTASAFAQKWQQVVVLKGALTIIASPDGRMNMIPVASSALAKAGSGDVLSGVIASLIGQGMGLFDAATLGAWVHAQAGVQAAVEIKSEASILARDIISTIPGILQRIS